MSVTVRPYRQQDSNRQEHNEKPTREWEVDIQMRTLTGVPFVNASKRRSGTYNAAVRWGEARERVLYEQMLKPPPLAEIKEVPILAQFVRRFIAEYAEAERQKASGIADKESRLRNHLLPPLGHKRLDHIHAEDVQKVKQRLKHLSAKTTNNVLTVLSMVLKKAVEWGVIDRLPCTIRLLKVPKAAPRFHDFQDFERLLQAARDFDWRAELAVLLGGEGGLRLGEMTPLEWADIFFETRQIRIERAEWKGIVSTPKSGQIRYVPMTQRLMAALREHRHLRHRRVCVPMIESHSPRRWSPTTSGARHARRGSVGKACMCCGIRSARISRCAAEPCARFRKRRGTAA